MRVLFAIALLALPVTAHAIEQCGSGKRYTCVVDGDTIWLRGEKIRLQGFDTPETTTNICGGSREVELGKRAARRLAELLSQGGTIERTGRDRYGRTLAVVRVEGREVGSTLIEEGLARKWPDGREFWCR